ncbi:hypothetical protein [Paenibacillus thermotolerans]|uniref:hypothetical protein n=1 Tax=Paenibacillus thermotolerans TaxID=3027807 RepID=UPI0023687138|nr:MULTISPECIES: hypothetical protein [unclassified Paenibacillus]
MDKRSRKKVRDERKSQTSSRRKREDRNSDIQPEHNMWGKIPKRLQSHYLLVLPQAQPVPEPTEPPKPAEALPLREWTKADLLRHKLKSSV